MQTTTGPRWSKTTQQPRQPTPDPRRGRGWAGRGVVSLLAGLIAALLGFGVTGAGTVSAFAAGSDHTYIDLGAGGTMGDTITGGNNVSTGGITQAIGDSDATVTLGDNTTITGNVNLHGGHDHMTIGAGSTVNGSITMGDDGSARDVDTLTIGAGSTITDYINTNTGNDTVTVGDNVTLLGGWNAIDTELGDDVDVPPRVVAGEREERLVLRAARSRAGGRRAGPGPRTSSSSGTRSSRTSPANTATCRAPPP